MPEGLEEFWSRLGGAGPLDFTQEGFFYTVERNESGEIENAAILQPYGHHHLAHLCSIHRNKKMFKFCKLSMMAYADHTPIGIVIVNTKGAKKNIDRLVEALGFTPIEIPGLWTEFYWNSKTLEIVN